MRILATIVSYIYIAIAFVSSLFLWGSAEMVPFRNDYTIPESIPEYQKISVEEKTDWTAKWIWDKETLTEKNVWTCLSKKVKVDEIPSELIANISADSKYWLYINGENVVFEGSVKRGDGFGYYDSVDVAPYLKVGENSICALVWFWGSEKNYSYNSSGWARWLYF